MSIDRRAESPAKNRPNRQITNIALYAMVSTAKHQAEDQLPQLRSYAEQNGWTVLEYLEVASAKHDRQGPVLLQLLKDAKAGRFQGVLCGKLFRFGHQLRALIDNIQTLNNANVRFICTSPPIVDTDQGNPTGKMVIDILRALAQSERDRLADHVRIGVARYKVDFRLGRIGEDKMRLSNTAKNKPHGAPRKVWNRGKVAELHAQGMSIRDIAAKLGTTYGPVRRVLQAIRDAEAKIAAG